MHFTEINKLGMAAKLIKIKGVTKKYYRSLATEKSAILKLISSLESPEHREFECCLMKEREELLAAHNVLEKAFSSSCNKMVWFKSDCISYIQYFEESSLDIQRYNNLKKKCKLYESNGQGIDKLAKIINQGGELEPELQQMLERISEVTLNIARDPARRIDYFRDVPKFKPCQRRNIENLGNTDEIVRDEPRASLT